MPLFPTFLIMLSRDALSQHMPAYILTCEPSHQHGPLEESYEEQDIQFPDAE